MGEEWKSQSDVNMQYFVINSYHSPVHCFRYYNFIVSIIFHRKQKRQKFPRKIISFGWGVSSSAGRVAARQLTEVVTYKAFPAPRTKWTWETTKCSICSATKQRILNTQRLRVLRRWLLVLKHGKDSRKSCMKGCLLPFPIFFVFSRFNFYATW